jgi:hypothetical protein
MTAAEPASKIGPSNSIGHSENATVFDSGGIRFLMFEKELDGGLSFFNNTFISDNLRWKDVLST